MQARKRWAAVALLAAGIAIGVVMVATPAGAHVSSWAHNWNKHIKPKADQRYQRIPTEPQHYSIPGAALVPDDGTRGDDFVSGAGDQNLGWCFTGGNFYAEIHLPPGARITGLRVDYRDDPGSLSDNGEAYITRMPFKGRGGSYEDIFFADLVETPGPGESASAVGSLQNAGAQTVDNFEQVYVIIGQGVLAGAAICGIDVRYRVNAPFAAARVAPAAAGSSSRP
jgi:hypothetical protein